MITRRHACAPLIQLCHGSDVFVDGVAVLVVNVVAVVVVAASFLLLALKRVEGSDALEAQPMCA